MKGLQLIICVETDKRSRTDIVYIKETISRFFEPVPNIINIDYIPMGGKGNYVSRKVNNEIKTKSRMFSSNGETVVIFCLDTDKYENNVGNQEELEKYKSFCKANGFDLIWFCHDIEEVYLGKSVRDNEKKRAAENFKVKGTIEQVSYSSLECLDMGKGRSNILIILGKYLKRTD